MYFDFFLGHRFKLNFCVFYNAWSSVTRKEENKTIKEHKKQTSFEFHELSGIYRVCAEAF